MEVDFLEQDLRLMHEIVDRHLAGAREGELNRQLIEKSYCLDRVAFQQTALHMVVRRIPGTPVRRIARRPSMSCSEKVEKMVVVLESDRSGFQRNVYQRRGKPAMDQQPDALLVPSQVKIFLSQ